MTQALELISESQVPFFGVVINGADIPLVDDGPDDDFGDLGDLSDLDDDDEYEYGRAPCATSLTCRITQTVAPFWLGG